MADDLVTPGGIVIPAEAMTWRFSRGTGPGGQGVNTADSRVELVADLTALRASRAVADRVREALGDSVRIVARAERSQLRNRQAALRRLAERVDRGGPSGPARGRRRARPGLGPEAAGRQAAALADEGAPPAADG